MGPHRRAQERERAPALTSLNDTRPSHPGPCLIGVAWCLGIIALEPPYCVASLVARPAIDAALYRRSQAHRGTQATGHLSSCHTISKGIEGLFPWPSSGSDIQIQVDE